jgi:hypothetical protein
MANTTNFGWETPDDTDLVKDGALAMRTLGNAIDTSFVDLKGGTTGQNLRKATNTDLDFTWAGDATNTVIDAEGDLLVGDSADTLQRLAIGTTGQVLTVDTAIDGKIKWAAPAGGGKVLQVVSATTTTSTNIASTNMTDTTITATITPTSATSKILILLDGIHSIYRASTNIHCAVDLLRGATVIQDFFNQGGGGIDVAGTTALEIVKNFSTNYLDSPNTTSATTYKLQAKVSTTANSGQVTWQHEGSPSTITLLEIGA